MIRNILRKGLFCLVLLALGTGLGYYLHSRQAVPYQVVAAVKRFFHLAPTASGPAGHWHPIQPGLQTEGLDPSQRQEVEKLLSLGYVQGSVPAPADTGVTICDSVRTGNGLRFYISGHAPEAVLMDRSGRVLHRWRYSYEEVSATRPEDFRAEKGDDTTACWRRAHLFPNGDVLAIFEGHGLIKLNKESQLLWSYAGKCHHDLGVAPAGEIYVLTREAGLVPHIHRDKPVLLDFVTILEPNGQVVRSIPLLAAFAESDYASFLDKAADSGDIFHTNTLEVFDGSLARLSPIFRAGGLLISLRELNVIAVVDPRTDRVVWALSGLWIRQHQPTLLDNGNILLFDNLGHRGRSKVIEFEPFTQRIVWAYEDGPQRSLYSKTCGSNQRLPNGNTLITESDNGRVLEVTPDQVIVWEYRNPHRAGKDNELIAAILEMVVLPEEFPCDWLPDLSEARH